MRARFRLNSGNNKLADNSHKHSIAYGRELVIIISFFASVFVTCALASYHSFDPGWSRANSSSYVANITGPVGAWLADVSIFWLGYAAYLLPILLFCIAGINYYALKKATVTKDLFNTVWRTLGLVFMILSGCALCSLHLAIKVNLPEGPGGLVGELLGWYLINMFGNIGSMLVLMAYFVCGLLLFLQQSLLTFLEKTGVAFWQHAKRIYALCAKGDYKQIFTAYLRVWPYLKNSFLSKKISALFAAKRAVATADAEVFSAASSTADISNPKVPPANQAAQHESQNATVDSVNHTVTSAAEHNQAQARVKSAAEQPAAGVNIFSNLATDEETRKILPSLDVLAANNSKGVSFDASQLEKMSFDVEAKLADFSVKAKVVTVHPGPVVTRFELQLAPGTKASKITLLATDLARSLSVPSVRVVEVIPGKSVIGLELPNAKRAMVTLKDVLDSEAYAMSSASLPLALGKDISGDAVVVDLAKMPHLLVAGTTGSGKSVGLNVMLLSLLYKHTSQDLRLILIDPKMLELSVYDGIPHLMTPVVTDMKQAASALYWCVAEMERRYRLLASLGVRNIDGYNAKVIKAQQSGEPLVDPIVAKTSSGEVQYCETLPKIVVLADEFADMIMVVGKQVEQLIARLAQKARAAGIHLILATQRPSVDVITGLIKANIPTRIAFQVSSRIDSRTIIDAAGAEQLLGHGDMLYLPAGVGLPTRVHGAYVTDAEVHRVVDLLRTDDDSCANADTILNYQDETSNDNSSGTTDGGEYDELYDQAVAFITQTRRASISSIQRKFKIGYNRAANIVESMEEAGVVSPVSGNGTREVLAPPPVASD